MLLIRRRVGESIRIGDSVEIQVLEVTRGQVKIGVTAPAEITILRKEIFLAEEANRAASRSLTAENLDKILEQIRR